MRENHTNEYFFGSPTNSNPLSPFFTFARDAFHRDRCLMDNLANNRRMIPPLPGGIGIYTSWNHFVS